MKTTAMNLVLRETAKLVYMNQAAAARQLKIKKARIERNLSKARRQHEARQTNEEFQANANDWGSFLKLDKKRRQKKTMLRHLHLARAFMEGRSYTDTEQSVVRAGEPDAIKIVELTPINATVAEVEAWLTAD